MNIAVNVDYQDVELLEKILQSKPFTSISSLSRSLDKSKISVSKRLKRLERKGFRFTVDIDYWAIGLKLSIAILRGYKNAKNIETRFLHSIIRLIPNSTLISYYKPIIKGTELDQTESIEYEDYLEADEVYGSRPDFNKYFDAKESKIVVDKKQLLQDITNSISNSNGVISEIKNMEKIRNAGKAKISEMDIKIVSLLEEYGVISPNLIAEKLGLKKSRVLKRLTIISRYIKSVSLNESPWSKSLPLIIVSSVKTKKPSYAKNIVSIISRHPLHKKTYLSSMTGEFVTMFHANSRIAELFAEIFNELSMKGIVNYYMTWATTSTNWKEYKLVEGPRYSKYTGTWIRDFKK